MRHAQWEERLHTLITANLDREHVYGRWDCLLGLAAETVQAVTGEDFARGHRGKYKSQASAVRYLKGLGFRSPAAMLDSLLEQKPIGFAGRGDLVLCPGSALGQPWDIPGVCMGDFALVIGTDGEREGLHRIPRALWLKAWAVGDHHSTIQAPKRKRARK